MIIDRENRFAWGQAVTASAASTDIIDLAPPSTGRDIGAGKPLVFVCDVDTLVTAVGSATVTVTLETATDAAFSSPVVLYSSPAVPKASMIAGYRICAVDVPRGVLRYLRANFTVATGPLTAGKFDAFLVETVQDNILGYASGYVA